VIKSLVTDRGFDNKTNVKWLEERGTFAGLCPRDPRALREAMKDEYFAQAQRRRAQTEGRIAIFKNEFLGRPMPAEGFANRALHVSWGSIHARFMGDRREIPRAEKDPGAKT
jgi:hypothetical protein